MENPQSILFRKYEFQREAPHVPALLFRELKEGREMLEIDEKLYFHLKFIYRTFIFYESKERFALKFADRENAIVEFFIDQERYFVRPPELVEN